MMFRSRYPDDWPAQVEAVRERAGWLCEVCMVPHGAIRSPRTGNPYVVYLQAAHVHHDHDNPEPELKAVCPACHARYYRRQRVHVPVLAHLCKRRRTLRRIWKAQTHTGSKNASPSSLAARASTEAPTSTDNRQPRCASSHCSRVQFGWQLKEER